MFEFNYEEDFEPKKNVLRLWLYTKKSDKPIHSIILPGMFNQSDYSAYALGFAFILLLEGAATVWVKSLGITIETIIAFIVLDIFLAIFGHIAYGRIIKFRNYVLVGSNSNESDKGIKTEIYKQTAYYNRKVTNWKIYRNIFNFLILVSGFMKFFWFYIDYATFDSTAMLIAFFYMAGAVLHILCTGFFLYTLYFNIKLKAQHRRYLRPSSSSKYTFDASNPRRLPMTREALVEATAGRHSIKKNGNEEYELVTNGVLTDENLSELIGKQDNPTQKRLVAIKGVEQQLSLMN